MSVDDLNNAIQLIQLGQPEQAQPILQALIQANQQDLTAWSWYVKSCTTPEKRLKALELCLRFNPGNAQVQQALEKLQSRLAAQTSQPVAPPAQPASPGPNYYESPYQAVAAPAVGLVAAEPTAAPAAAPDQTQGLRMPDEPPSRPFAWHEVWIKALTQANAPSYFELLRDPSADTSRAYLWVFSASLIAGLFLLAGLSLGSGILNSLKQAGALGNLNTSSTDFYLILLILIPVGSALSVFGLMINAGIYNLLAKLLGGSGNFSRTFYLMAAYTAPISIVNSLLSLIPVVSCLSVFLGFYTIWMHVYAIQTAQRMSTTVRALIVVMIPTLLALLVFCVAAFVASQSLMQIIRSQAPTY